MSISLKSLSLLFILYYLNTSTLIGFMVINKWKNINGLLFISHNILLSYLEQILYEQQILGFFN